MLKCAVKETSLKLLWSITQRIDADEERLN